MQMQIEKLQKRASMASNLLKVMANESRLLILCRLLDGEKSVQEMERALGIAQSTLSQHLSILRRERLVKTRKEGQHVYYDMASVEAVSVIRTLYDSFCMAKGKPRAAH